MCWIHLLISKIWQSLHSRCPYLTNIGDRYLLNILIIILVIKWAQGVVYCYWLKFLAPNFDDAFLRPASASSLDSPGKMEAVKWLERLERGEISTVIRRDLNVELTPVEIKRRIIKYGDFTKLNNKINNEKSETTHDRMLKDPKEWEEYHRQYREARKTWQIVPYEEIIKRIKQLSPRLPLTVLIHNEKYGNTNQR